jgi:hypothetical protein
MACVCEKNRYFEKFKIIISNETLYMKAFQYKMYFTHIDSLQILKSLEDIQVFFSIQNVWPSGE